MRRGMILALGLGGVAAVAAAGFLAGRQVQSPADAASRRAAPPPSLITVPVERRVLSTEVITRGTVQYGAAQKVGLATSALKSGPGIVTSVPVAGTPLAEGDVVMAVSGRPVFVLAGAQPSYRDLAPGSVGKDVLQLESALQRLGFEPGPVDEVYDEQTSVAVAKWYLAAGYNPQGPTAEQLAARRAAEGEGRQLATDVLDAEAGVRAALQAVDAANARVRLAELALQAAGPSAATDLLRAQTEVTRLEGQVGAAEAELKAARLRLSEAKSGRGAPALRGELAVLEAEVAHTESLVKQAEAELTAARASGREATTAANAEVKARRRALEEAQQHNPPVAAVIGAARDELAAADAKARAAGQTAAADELAKQRAVDAAGAAVTAARARLAERRAGAAPPPTPAELAALEAAVLAAEGGVVGTTGELAAARSTLAGLASTAGPAAKVATIELEAAQADLASERAGLEIARRRVALAGSRAALTDDAGRLGIQVPADEVLFFASLPMRVNEVFARPGEQSLGVLMTVTNSRLTVVGSLAAAEARLVRTGAMGTISATDLGLTVAAAVSEIASAPGTRGAEPQRYFFEVTPGEAPLSLAGASVVVRIVVVSSTGEVLTVPVAALSAAADGRSRIQVRTSAGPTVEVTVDIGLAAGGLVEVRPIGADLAPGDLVVIPNLNAGKQ